MDNRVKETLSALVDDEVTEFELRKLLASEESEEIKLQCRRYMQISRLTKQVSQQNLASVDSASEHFGGIDVSASVAAVIRGELEVSTPSAVDDCAQVTMGRFSAVEQQQAAARQSQMVSEKALAHANRRRFPSWLGYAATVAFASLFTATIMLNQTEQPLDNGAVLVAASNSVADPLPPAATNDTGPWTFEQYQVNAEQKNRLNDLLLRHAGNGYTSPDLGMTAYTRVANYDVQGF